WEMYCKSVSALFPLRGLLKVPKFKDTDPTSTGFKWPIITPFDEKTCKETGEPPFEWLNLLYYEKVKTVFTFPGATEKEFIPFDALIGRRFKFIPDFKLSHIYAGGGKMSEQIKVVSGTVT